MKKPKKDAVEAHERRERRIKAVAEGRAARSVAVQNARKYSDAEYAEALFEAIVYAHTNRLRSRRSLRTA